MKLCYKETKCRTVSWNRSCCTGSTFLNFTLLNELLGFVPADYENAHGNLSVAECTSTLESEADDEREKGDMAERQRKTLKNKFKREEKSGQQEKQFSKRPYPSLQKNQPSKLIKTFPQTPPSHLTESFSRPPNMSVTESHNNNETFSNPSSPALPPKRLYSSQISPPPSSYLREEYFPSSPLSPLASCSQLLRPAPSCSPIGATSKGNLQIAL